MPAKRRCRALNGNDRHHRGSPTQNGRCGERARLRGGAAHSRLYQFDARRSECCRGRTGRHVGFGSPAAGCHGAWHEPAAAGSFARVEAAPEARSDDVRPDTKVRIDVASATVLTLLAEREPGATICPSEVARKIAAEMFANDEADWRAAMPTVHAAVDHLVDQENITLSWKGRALSARSGPYRISRRTSAFRQVASRQE